MPELCRLVVCSSYSVSLKAMTSISWLQVVYELHLYDFVYSVRFNEFPRPNILSIWSSVM
jgi:hypothetical protein